jgi:hypothetical protein
MFFFGDWNIWNITLLYYFYFRIRGIQQGFLQLQRLGLAQMPFLF